MQMVQSWDGVGGTAVTLPTHPLPSRRANPTLLTSSGGVFTFWM